MPKKLFKNFDGSPSAKMRNSSIELKLNCINMRRKIRLKMKLQESMFFIGAYYSRGRIVTQFSQKGSVLFREGVLTEGVRYLEIIKA